LSYSIGYEFSGNVGWPIKLSYCGSKDNAKPAKLQKKRCNILNRNGFGAADHLLTALLFQNALPVVHWLLPKSNMFTAIIIGV
jgi:hypothetical protein